ncbi:MAG: DNA primase [Bacteroidales bacterium]|nr:DNA primase [Bacteroidales bacterium]
MIPQETVNLILDTARIEDVIGDFVTLKRRGANLVACCPFHNEKTPSFYVSPSKGIYKCFGCGKAGSAVGFLMEYEHSSYVEALRYLARKYHIEIQEEEESAEAIASRQRRESLMLVSEYAGKFFADQLKGGEGRSVGWTYYRDRGLEDETIAKWGLGWAPSGRTALIDAAVADGYKTEYLLGAGLAVEREDGSGLADKFRERVMFPIHSVSGRVIAFSGRTLRSDNPAKYVNSPETEIYVKSRNLLGIYFAKSEISRLGKCILVEGNMDVVMMHQLGIRNVVASCGTSLTVEQVRLIHKFTDNLTIMYDGDSAGIHAALRGTDLALAEGMNVRIILLPEGEDPDSFAKTHTLAQVQEYMEAHEQDFISFKTDLLLQDTSGDPLKKANLINDIADTVAQIPDAVKRSVYVEAVAAKFNIESSILFNRIATRRQRMISEARDEAFRSSRGSAPVEESAPRQPSARELSPDEIATEQLETDKIVAPVERDLLYFLLNYGSDPLVFESDSEFYSAEGEPPTVTEFIAGVIDADGGHLLNPVYQRVYDAYLTAFDEGRPQEEIIRSMLNSPDQQIAYVAAQHSIEKYQLTVKSFEDALTTKDSWLVKQVPKLILTYSDKKLESRLDTLRREMASPEGQERMMELMTEMVRLQKLQKSVRDKMNK